MNERQHLLDANDAIVRACDCLGEGLASLAGCTGSPSDVSTTLEAVEDTIQKALLMLWRYRWDLGRPSAGELDAHEPAEQKAEAAE